MAQFGWAYVNCSDQGGSGSGSAGPAHSIQFVTESGGATTGSAYLTYYTGSTSGGTPGRSGHTLYLTGTLIVTGAISASSYHIANITQIGTTGSTFFGNTNDDVHIRTGSLAVSKVGFGTGSYILSASAHDESVRVRGFGGNYTQVNATPYVIQSADYIIGIVKANNPTMSLPPPSGSNTGRLLVIKDEMPSRGTGSIHIKLSSGAAKIDNSTSYVMTGSLPAINLYSNGSNWFVF
tara:strand:+ start:689 stop:1396 length:708 start_codon:yes stop_codon:yes gene_type:complete